MKQCSFFRGTLFGRWLYAERARRSRKKIPEFSRRPRSESPLWWASRSSERKQTGSDFSEREKTKVRHFHYFLGLLTAFWTMVFPICKALWLKLFVTTRLFFPLNLAGLPLAGGLPGASGTQPGAEAFLL